MANYFENPSQPAVANKPSPFAQYQGKVNGGFMEWGTYSFATTGPTVKVPTYFSKITAATVIATGYDSDGAALTVNPSEQYHCDLIVTNDTTGQYVTVTRTTPDANVEFHFPVDNAKLTSNNLEDPYPLMVAQKDMTLTAVEVYTGTATNTAGTKFDIGHATTADRFVKDADMSTATDSTVFLATSAIVAGTPPTDGDPLIARTTAGAADNPADWCISIAATETVTPASALTFSFIFFGLW